MRRTPLESGLLLARRAAEAGTQRELTELGNAENFLSAAAIARLIVEMDFLFAPGDAISMGFDAVEMTAEPLVPCA